MLSGVGTDGPGSTEGMYPRSVFGRFSPDDEVWLRQFVDAAQGLAVLRASEARSTTPYPASIDLELALAPMLLGQGFQHHVLIHHPRTGERFEYDFWRPSDGIAVEIMGYRADDEVYKDILKFHVHDATRVGVLLVPKWKWVSGRRTGTNARATLKALAFAESFMAVDALVAILYDWVPDAGGGSEARDRRCVSSPRRRRME